MMARTFSNATLANPRNAVREPSGAILVTIDLQEIGSEGFEVATYALIEGDSAPAACWLRSLIESNQLPVTDADAAYMTARYWEDVRGKRDRLLRESDIAVLPDRWEAMTPEERSAWAAYRQALRDIPQSHSEPLDIDWPTPPTQAPA